MGHLTSQAGIDSSDRDDISSDRLRAVRLVTVLWLLAACGGGPTSEHVAIDKADALWGGDAFCARTGLGLACWSSSESAAVARGPTIVTGLYNVTQVVIAAGEGCALHDGDVTCFSPGAAESRGRTFDEPTQLVATRGYQSTICVLHASGVSCWAAREKPELRPEMGRPTRLLAGASSATICGVYPDGTRCFPQDLRDGARVGVLLRDVKDPRGVFLNTVGGNVWVIDGAKLLYGEFQGTLQVTGNPFASSDPLAVDATFRPLTSATAGLRPVDGVGPVRALAPMSAWALALDDRDVVQLDFHGGAFDLKRLPHDAVPSALFCGAYQDYFTSEGGALWQRGWNKGKRIDRTVKGAADVIDVEANLYFTCALERAGGVTCFESSRM